MKTLINKIVAFVQREWFLLIMVATIALIVILFELS
jgi:hypothetical protein